MSLAATHETCPQCGARLAAGLPAKLCLRCLLSFGLKSATSEEPASSPADLDDEFKHFSIIEKIGEGGCGIVYRALQRTPIRREVAIKVIKLGLDTRTVIARFEAEQQALALMDHPGIARVFEAGATAKGRPYFVMELIRGERITDYCDRQRLTITQRLELFTEVCQAVQHAHQKGIIHRDLKPSNIFVTTIDGRPCPKIIDFGIAKATARQRLGGETLYTAFDQFVGTPAYMSPEQAGLTGEDVDTRSDIYSLGVLLYELLTGRPPFDPEQLRVAALDEVCRIIRDEDPARPSTRVTTLNPQELTKAAQCRRTAPARLPNELRGDLDWIVMKTLEKERDRRYDTAIGLASDILRLLKDEPVGARPPGTAYRLQKWMRRNRSLAGGIAVIGLVLIASSVISTILAVRARRAEEAERTLRASAQEAALAARAEAEAGRHIISLLNSTYSNWRPVPGRRRHTLAWTGVIEEVRRQAQDNLLPDNHAELERLSSLMILADHAAWISEFAAAENMLGEALKLVDQLRPRQETLRAGMLECLGLVFRRAGKTNEAQQIFGEALAVREQVQADQPTAMRASYAFTYLCSQARQKGEWERAIKLGQLHAEALRLTYGSTNLAMAYAQLDLGQSYAALQMRSETGAAYAQALACLRALPSLFNDPELSEICDDIHWAFELAAAHLKTIGQDAEADALPAEALALVQRLQRRP